MTTPDFSHVISQHIRGVLEGKKTDLPAILGAAYSTEYFMREDWRSEHVAIEVMEAREQAVEDMSDCIAARDLDGTVAAMRRYWLV